MSATDIIYFDCLIHTNNKLPFLNLIYVLFIKFILLSMSFCASNDSDLLLKSFEL